jgi:hypothetical protein
VKQGYHLSHCPNFRGPLSASETLSIKDAQSMSEQQIQKTESHITSLPREIDQSLAIALGEMVVAFGRLEDMFKVAIKRLENKKPFDQAIKEFSGGGGTLGKLVIHCRSHFPNLTDTCNKAENLKHGQAGLHSRDVCCNGRRWVRQV